MESRGSPNGKTTITKTPNQNPRKSSKARRHTVLDFKMTANPKWHPVTKTAALSEAQTCDQCNKAEISRCVDGPTGFQPEPKSFTEEAKVFLTNGTWETSPRLECELGPLLLPQTNINPRRWGDGSVRNLLC